MLTDIKQSFLKRYEQGRIRTPLRKDRESPRRLPFSCRMTKNIQLKKNTERLSCLFCAWRLSPARQKFTVCQGEFSFYLYADRSMFIFLSLSLYLMTHSLSRHGLLDYDSYHLLIETPRPAWPAACGTLFHFPTDYGSLRCLTTILFSNSRNSIDSSRNTSKRPRRNGTSSISAQPIRVRNSTPPIRRSTSPNT